MVMLSMAAMAEPMVVSLSYDATLGGSTADNPTNQGFTANEILLGPGGNAWPTNESGTLAWVIDDNNGAAAYNNPQYYQDINRGIGRIRKRLMYDHGWVHEYRVKALGKSQFISWGCAANGNPWTNANFRAGYYFGLSGDAFYVHPEGTTASTLGAGSGSSFHTVRAEGQPKTNSVKLYIDGAYQQTYDFAIGSSADPNRISVQSGSSNEKGRTAQYNRFSLTPVIPASVLFASEFQQVDLADGNGDEHGSLHPDAALVGTWGNIVGDPQVRQGANNSTSTKPNHYDIGAGSKYLAFSGNQGCDGVLPGRAFRNGLTIEFDLHRWGSSVGAAVRGPVFSVWGSKGTEILNFKLKSAPSNQEIRYNVSDPDNSDSGTYMDKEGGRRDGDRRGRLVPRDSGPSGFRLDAYA